MTHSTTLSLLNVIVIDDDENMRVLLRRVLLRGGVANIIEAASGEMGWGLLTTPKNKINFVICDWELPGMSGIELLRRVKLAKPIMPALMITGRSDLASIQAARLAGIDGFIVKPVSPQELLLKVQFIVQGAHDKRMPPAQRPLDRSTAP